MKKTGDKTEEPKGESTLVTTSNLQWDMKVYSDSQLAALQMSSNGTQARDAQGIATPLV